MNTGFGQIIIPDTSKMNMAEKLIVYQTERKRPTLSVFINIIPNNVTRRQLIEKL